MTIDAHTKTGKPPVPGEDHRMLMEAGWWPSWPLLCLKRYREQRGMPELGVVVAGKPTVIYLMDMYTALETVLDDVPEGLKKQYENVDALLADGWIVD